MNIAMGLYSNRSRETSKCGENISDALGCASCATLLYSSHIEPTHGNLKSICKIR